MKKWFILPVATVFTLSALSVAATGTEQTDNDETEGSEDLKLGIDVLLEDRIDELEDKNVGLITNPTGVDEDLNSIVDLLHEHEDVDLVSMFGPEHGVRGDAQAGDDVDKYIDEQTGLPVYSLYGDTQKPTPEMLEDVDVLLFDIQDVGARFYTYIYTMAYAMEAAGENDVEMMVLDRPNPLGGQDVAGPVLDPDYASFVGLYPIPLQHGMTVGELAQLFNEEFELDADLTVMEMEGWERGMKYDDTDLEWVLPSPNMPTFDTAVVYPGTTLIEGTNVSEGRGTTKPFETIGAPFIDGTALAEELNELDLPGVQFRAAYFTPMFSKHEGELSGGIEIHVQDDEVYESLETGLHIVKTIHDNYPEDFEFDAFFDNLMGNSWVREEIENGTSVDEIIDNWQDDLEDFKQTRNDYLLYFDSVTELREVVETFEEQGAFASEEAARELLTHLTAVEQFEQQGDMAKVVEHMEGFYHLLDNQQENDQITDEAYQTLTEEADVYMEQWQ
ncbi:Uncharacterized conserved protein YbbC, DUF1343 family [Natribacillus halophilus]|uniref:Uncharacterized conserved protein YbbC, DUF1343 family n=1 Tax=Natribacillus halophilus TaxID=549003 RepID=A0A1G8MUB0_9BACI|nr:Uncharacterized conserved protein YbbC, DUF1343 family [Natribacillus halophilus]